jgi:hypothetical protein
MPGMKLSSTMASCGLCAAALALAGCGGSPKLSPKSNARGGRPAASVSAGATSTRGGGSANSGRAVDARRARAPKLPPNYNWEATSTGGAQASFALVPLNRAAGHTEAVEDLVVDAPIRCANAPNAAAQYDLQTVSGTFALSPQGSFAAGQLTRGAGTTVQGQLHGRVLQLTYRHLSKARNPFDDGVETCDTGSIQLTAHPAHRLSVQDGVWVGRSASNEPVQFRVTDGGRALVSGPVGAKRFYAWAIAPTSQHDTCTGVASTGSGASTPGGLEAGGGRAEPFVQSGGMLIAPNGTFDNNQYAFGDSSTPEVAGRFVSSDRAVGVFDNTGERCKRTWSATPQ